MAAVTCGRMVRVRTSALKRSRPEKREMGRFDYNDNYDDDDDDDVDAADDYDNADDDDDDEDNGGDDDG